jgi:NADH-quinone oxidoreductase subunit E
VREEGFAMAKNFAGMDAVLLDEVLAGAEGEGSLIQVLQKAQDIFGYLPKDVLVHISERMGVPVSQVFGVVTFYAQFHLEPRGRNIIRSCQGTACHVRGANDVLQEIKRCLEIGDDAGTTKDLRYTLETVACIGCCGLSPVITINGETHGRITPDKIKGILVRYE